MSTCTHISAQKSAQPAVRALKGSGEVRTMWASALCLSGCILRCPLLLHSLEMARRRVPVLAVLMHDDRMLLRLRICQLHACADVMCRCNMYAHPHRGHGHGRRHGHGHGRVKGKGASAKALRAPNSHSSVAAPVCRRSMSAYGTRSQTGLGPAWSWTQVG